MSEIMNFFDWAEIVHHLAYLGLAFVLALPVGWNRETSSRSLGLRTFPLVSMSSCGFVLLATASFGDDAGAVARVIEGIVTGVGFLGGGAIVKEGFEVHGISTAASIWMTASIGVAIGMGSIEIALVLSAANFLILRWLGRLGDKLTKDEDG